MTSAFLKTDIQLNECFKKIVILEKDMESKKPEVKKRITSHTNIVRTVCFSPDQTKLCSAGFDLKVILTNLRNNQTEKVSTDHDFAISGSDFSTDGKFLVTGSWDSSVQIWKVCESGNSTKLEGTVGNHNSEVNCVLCFPQNDPFHVISSSDDKTIKIWSVERMKEYSTLLGCEGVVYSVDILPDNRTIVSGDGCSLNGTSQIRIWDLRSRKSVKTLEYHKDDVNSVQFHPDSFSLASGSDDETIQIIDFRTFQLLQKYDGHSSYVDSVCFHPSGKYLLSGSTDYTIKVFDLLEKKVLFTLGDHFNEINCVKFSPDGKLFASGSEDKKVFLWDFPLGRMMGEDKYKDEDERVNYLVHQDLLVDVCEDTCYERNVLKIKIDDYCSLFSYKFLL